MSRPSNCDGKTLEAGPYKLPGSRIIPAESVPLCGCKDFVLQRFRSREVQTLADEHRIALFLDHDRAFFGSPYVATVKSQRFGLRFLRSRLNF